MAVAAGRTAIAFDLVTMLGLEPRAFDGRLDIVNPQLPPFITWLEMRRIRVGQAKVDLRFERDGHGRVRTEVTKNEGAVEVVIQDQRRSGPD